MFKDELVFAYFSYVQVRWDLFQTSMFHVLRYVRGLFRKFYSHSHVTELLYYIVPILFAQFI